MPISANLFITVTASYARDMMAPSKARIRDIEVEIIKEKNGTYGVAWSALGIYSVGTSVEEAKKGFSEALDLHLSVIREKALRALAQKA